MDAKETCKVCWLADKVQMPLEQRRASTGQDYLYCGYCHTSVLLPPLPNEKEVLCGRCQMVTWHVVKGNKAVCKCCDKHIEIVNGSER